MGHDDQVISNPSADKHGFTFSVFSRAFCLKRWACAVLFMETGIPHDYKGQRKKALRENFSSFLLADHAAGLCQFCTHCFTICFRATTSRRSILNAHQVFQKTFNAQWLVQFLCIVKLQFLMIHVYFQWFRLVASLALSQFLRKNLSNPILLWYSYLVDMIMFICSFIAT